MKPNRMKTYSGSITALLFLLLLSLQSCEKKTTEKEELVDDNELVIHSEDQSFLSAEMEAITNDVNVPLEASFGGVPQDGLICSSTITYDTAGNLRKITIIYNGTDCGGIRSRSGSVMISMPSSVNWKDAGAEITVTYQQLKITRISDKKSITIDGTHKLINVGGGLLVQLLFGRPEIRHSIVSTGISITFDDGAKRVWQVARQRLYTIAGGGTISITGLHEEGSNSGIAEWGTDRFGHPFVTSITEPLVVSGACQYRLVSGAITHEHLSTTATLTFGLDVQGNRVSCPLGKYYFKLSWKGVAGNERVYIASY
jgi:hypothetical protein